MLYAKSLLYRNDLLSLKENDDIYTVQSKQKTIQSNYKKSALIFKTNVLKLEELNPNDKSLGTWYFHWAVAEQFSENFIKAIELYEKSFQHDSKLTLCLYNISVLYQNIGKTTESKLYWNRYKKQK